MGPLQGLRILDFTEMGSGPFSAMLFADMGADVLRVDRATPGDTGWNRDPRLTLTKRGRPSLALDLKADRGRDLALRLITGANALIEGFRPGVMERLGLGPDVALAANPRLVYGRVTGWGQTGPLSKVAGHDVNFLALSGVLDSIGYPDRPPVQPTSLLGDFAAGGLYLAYGVVCALLEAQRSGLGQVVDASIFDGLTSLSTPIHGFLAAGTWRNERRANSSDGGAPFNSVYATKDGKAVAIGAIERRFYDTLLQRLGLQATDLPDRSDRANWPALRQRFEAIFCTRTRDEWVAVMAGAEACFSPVLSLYEAREHPHAIAREAFVELDGILQPAPAPRLSRTPAKAGSAPSSVGADSRTALAAWGIGADEIDDLVERGVVVQADITDSPA